jgi:DNA repair protein RecO (recombination protein O)
MSRPSVHPAYVLHQWPWSESSQIIELFTREQGRVAVVAKGVKRPYSQLRAVLLPFQRVSVLFGRAKAGAGADAGSEIQTLRSAEYAGGASVLPAERLFAGFYLNELLMKLLARQDPHERLFDAYAEALQALALATLEGEGEAALRAFELELMRETGVLPEFSRDTVTQQPVQATHRYRLRPEAGLVAAPAHEPALTGGQWSALQTALDAHDGDGLRRTCAELLQVLRPQLRSLLHYHLGSPQLRTRQVMLDVRKLLESAPPSGTR